MAQVERGSNRIYGIRRDRPALREVRPRRGADRGPRRARSASASCCSWPAGRSPTRWPRTTAGPTAPCTGLGRRALAGRAWRCWCSRSRCCSTTPRAAGSRRCPGWPSGPGSRWCSACSPPAGSRRTSTLSGSFGSIYGPLAGVFALLLWSAAVRDRAVLRRRRCAPSSRRCGPATPSRRTTTPAARTGSPSTGDPGSGPRGADAFGDAGGARTVIVVDAEAWDERYAATELVWSLDPTSSSPPSSPTSRPGRAVDLAAGEGRNAIWLARRGWQVTAVDFSQVGAGQGPRRWPATRPSSGCARTRRPWRATGVRPRGGRLPAAGGGRAPRGRAPRVGPLRAGRHLPPGRPRLDQPPEGTGGPQDPAC